MGSSPGPTSSPSSFLFFPNTPTRKASVDSVWSKFSSPYDPSSSIDRYRTVTRALWSSHHRLAQSPVSVASKSTGSTSLPRHSSSLKTRRLNFSFITSPLATAATKDSVDGQGTHSGPAKKERKGRVTREELRISRSAEVLDDYSHFADRASKKPVSVMSKSTDELETVRKDWLLRLERCKVRPTKAQSEESLCLKLDTTQGEAGRLKQRPNRFLRLRSADNEAPQDERPDLLHDYLSLQSLDVFANDEAQQKDTEELEEGKDEEEYEGNSTTNHEKAPLVIVVTGPGDHPPITVRPGVSLDSSRDASSKPRKSVPPPDTHLKRNRSTSCTLEDRERTFPDRDENLGVSASRIPDEVAAKSCRRKESDPMLQDIPQMPDLSLAKYNLGSRFKWHETWRPFSIYQRALLEASPERVFAGDVACLPPSGRTERGRTRAVGRDIFATPTLKYPGGGLWDKTVSARRNHLRSSMSLRSRSEERRKGSLQRSLSMKQRYTRHSAEGRIVPQLHLSPPSVVSEDEQGICRGLIFDGSTSARTGVFPSSLVVRGDSNVGGMSGRGKPAPTVKKVSPPTVPDTASLTHRHSGSSFSSGVYSGGDQRSSYSSSVSDENPPPSPRSPARVGGGTAGNTGGGNCDHGQLGRLGTTTTTTTTSTEGGGGGGGGGQPLPSSSPSHYHNQQQFTFPAAPHQQQMPQFAHLMCSKTSPGSPHHLPPDGTYTYLTYQHQTSLEDQGIDVQSPGRSSPGSGSGSSTTGSTASSGGCRNSTTSLDSGRASTTTHSHQHRLSGQSYDSGSILRHSYHSSSSSLGSMEHDNTPHVNVLELLNNGVRDSEVLRAWLTDLRFEEYYDKFMSAGYDMPTISRMTPEDLNAIGITKPAHRKKLKAEITRLNISDGLPDYIPGRLEDWLSILRLEDYTASLRQQKYVSVEQMTQLTWEDLEDIGITKLGHQKKVMLAIKRVKDIMAGKKFTTSQDSRQQSVYGTHEIMIARESCEGRDQFSGVPEFRTFPGTGHYGNGEHNRLSGYTDAGVHYGVAPHYPPNVQYGPMPPPQAHVHPMQQQQQIPGQFHQSNQFPASQGPSPPGTKLPNVPPSHPLPGPGQVQYRPDVVAVQVRPGGRGRNMESLEEPIYGTYQTFHPDSRMPHGQGPMSLGNLPPRPFPPSTLSSSHPQRSMDDGDITPTNEYANNYEGGGTLPRPRTANKLRPVAKVTAKTRADVHEVPQFIKDGMNLKNPTQGEEICMKELNLKTLNRQNSEKAFNSNQGTGSSNNTPQGTPKKIPPPPPRRSNSISETSKEAATQEGQYGYLRRGLSYGYMGIKNNLQPDVTPDLPPPPAPPDSANHQHLPDDFPPPPPPLTCVTMASATRITASSTITTSSMTSDSLATSQTSTTSSDDDASTGFRPRRNDSNASFKSTSSTDSESLPFANENAGTIKQRACRPHPGLTMLDTRNSPHSSPRSSPALRRKEAQPPLRQNPIATSETSVGQLPKSNSSSPDGTGDVLNDIGNMLANLTDELDAMLEQEVNLKN